MQIVSCLELMANLFIFIHNGGIEKLLYSPHLKMVESLSKGYNVLLLVINDHSLGTEIQLTIFSIQLDCVLIIKLILVKSTVNPTRKILKLEI